MLGRGDIVLDIVFFLMIVFCIGLLVYLKREPVEFVDPSLKRDWEDLKEKFASTTCPCQDMWLGDPTLWPHVWGDNPAEEAAEEMDEMDLDPANASMIGNIYHNVFDD